jgi:O-antigen ligase
MRELLRSLTRSQVGGFGIQALFAIFVPLLVLPLALKSIPLAVLLAASLILLIMAACIGLERTGSLILVLAFAASPLDDLRPIPGLHFVALSDICFAVGFTVLVPVFAVRRLQLPVLYVAGALGMLAVGVLTSIGDENTGQSFNHLLRFAVGALALAALLQWWESNRRWTIAAAVGYVAGNVINVVASHIKGIAVDDRYSGLTTHPNVMGLCAALGFALGPFLFAAVGRHYRWLVVIGTAVCFWGIWISGSRAALAAVLVLLAFYPLLTRSVYSALAVAAFGFLSVYVVDWAQRNAESNALGRLLGGGSASGSDDAREALAQVAIDQFWEHPVMGGGLASVMEAHSIYLQLLASIGIIGAAFFVIVMISLVRPLVELPKPYNFLAAPALTYALAGLVSPLLWDRYIWCTLAFSLMAIRLAAQEHSTAAGDDLEEPQMSASIMIGERRGVGLDS